jgi:hypothetical protein
MAALGLGLATALFYLLYTSYFLNFDGVACAIAVELGDWQHLVHGNHLLYGVLARWFLNLWRAFGYQGSALIAMKGFDALLGGAAAGTFFSLLRKQGLSWKAALCSTVGLVFSYAFWFWSLEPQVYMLGTFLIVLALKETLAGDAKKAGLFHGLAVLAHVEHVMFLAPAAYLVADKKARKTHLAILAAVVALGYGLVAAFVIPPSGWKLWLLGSAALTSDRSFQWHGGYSVKGVFEFLRMTFRLFAEHEHAAGAVRYAGWALGAFGLWAAAWGAKQKPKLGTAAALWLGAYAVLFLSWEPFTMVYRVSDLVPLWLLIAFTAQRRLLEVALGVIVLGHYNGSGPIKRACDPANNAAYQEAMWIASKTPENAWVTATAIDQVYLPYFAHRKPLNLRYFAGKPEALEARLAELERAGEPVYFTAGAMAQGWVVDFARVFSVREAAREGQYVLYSLTRRGTK